MLLWTNHCDAFITNVNPSLRRPQERPGMKGYSLLSTQFTTVLKQDSAHMMLQPISIFPSSHLHRLLYLTKSLASNQKKLLTCDDDVPVLPFLPPPVGTWPTIPSTSLASPPPTRSCAGAPWVRAKAC